MGTTISVVLSQISMNSVLENAPAKVPSAFHFSVETFRPIERKLKMQNVKSEENKNLLTRALILSYYFINPITLGSLELFIFGLP